jgi:hypothetical protein
MKKIILLLTFAFLITNLYAQEKEPGGKLQTLKAYYITKKINLTSEEGQKFWPIYNKYTDEIRQVYMQNKGGDEIALEEKIVEIRKKYKSQFQTVLSDERVNQFFKADKEFNEMAKREAMERRQQKKQQNQQR